jgi:hypothetical protein
MRAPAPTAKKALPKGPPAPPVNILAPLIDELGQMQPDLRAAKALIAREETIKAVLRNSLSDEYPLEQPYSIEGLRFAADISPAQERRYLRDCDEARKLLGPMLWDHVQVSCDKLAKSTAANLHGKLFASGRVGPRYVTSRPRAMPGAA